MMFDPSSTIIGLRNQQLAFDQVRLDGPVADLRNPAAADGQQGRLFIGFAARRAARPDGVRRRDDHPLRASNRAERALIAGDGTTCLRLRSFR